MPTLDEISKTKLFPNHLDVSTGAQTGLRDADIAPDSEILRENHSRFAGRFFDTLGQIRRGTSLTPGATVSVLLLSNQIQTLIRRSARSSLFSVGWLLSTSRVRQCRIA